MAYLQGKLNQEQILTVLRVRQWEQNRKGLGGDGVGVAREKSVNQRWEGPCQRGGLFLPALLLYCLIHHRGRDHECNIKSNRGRKLGWESKIQTCGIMFQVGNSSKVINRVIMCLSAYQGQVLDNQMYAWCDKKQKVNQKHQKIKQKLQLKLRMNESDNYDFSRLGEQQICKEKQP